MDISQFSTYVSMDDVRAHPDLAWSLERLSLNPGITIQDVRTLELPNATGAWNWYDISRIVSRSDLERYPDEPWVVSGILLNPNITITLLQRMLSMDELEGMMFDLSSSIDISEVRAHPDLAWDMDALSVNSTLTVQDIHTLDLPNATGDWNWDSISEHASIDEIVAHPDEPWNLEMILSVDDRDFSRIMHMHFTGAVPSDWECITTMYGPHINVVHNNPYWVWDMEFVSASRTLTVQDIHTLDLPNATGEWDWEVISEHISMNEVRAHPDLPWNMEGLARNRELTVADAKKYGLL